jgi:hypothetical protein
MRRAKLKHFPELDMGLAAIILDCRDRDFNHSNAEMLLRSTSSPPSVMN